jgi:hypothetical protein
LICKVYQIRFFLTIVITFTHIKITSRTIVTILFYQKNWKEKKKFSRFFSWHFFNWHISFWTSKMALRIPQTRITNIRQQVYEVKICSTVCSDTYWLSECEGWLKMKFFEKKNCRLNWEMTEVYTFKICQKKELIIDDSWNKILFFFC